MQQSLTIHQLAAEVQRQQQTKKDYLSPTSQLLMEVVNNTPQLRIGEVGQFGIRNYAHSQIASRLQIPRAYYDRMIGEAPELLVSNVNHWLHSIPEKRMLRTLDGNVRAFLSSRYRTLDNADMVNAVLPVLSKMGLNVEQSSFAITDERLYIKAISNSITAEIRTGKKIGDVVQAGVVVSNSEVGCGMIKVEPLLFTLRCLNGMIARDQSLRKYHIGRNIETDAVEEFFRDETRQLDDKAFWAKTQDVVRGALNRDVFQRLVDRLTETTDQEITGDPVKVVELTATRYDLSEKEQHSVLDHLIRGGDLSQYGLLNAVTAAAQGKELNYQRSTDLERIGGDILSLAVSEWDSLNQTHHRN
jgi:hypothetical protein